MDVGLRFKEIEHKFIVPSTYDVEALTSRVEAMGPSRRVDLRVRDRYFITEAGRAWGFILRHRHDRELHELTLKSVTRDAEVRDEINLKLRPVDQDATVDAFVRAQRPIWQGVLWKDIRVWHFPECEVVYYRASTDGRSIDCVEFEAVHQTTLDAALAVMARFEDAAGFGGEARTPASLVELMWPDVFSELGWRTTP